MTKFVFDTNVLISSILIPNSLSFKAFEKALNKGKIYSSENCINELIEVINRPKFKKYFSEEFKNKFLIDYLNTIKIIEVKITINACSDPKDNKFLELAISSKADVIISGDQDLLILNPFKKIKILNPKQFLDL
jgi:uncharacterized protein